MPKNIRIYKETAKSFLQTANAHQPKTPDILNRLAFITAFTNTSNDAINVYLESLKIDPDDDRDTINMELILADLQTIEKRYDKIRINDLKIP